MKLLSRFDLSVIGAFVVIGLLGAGAWWYFSSQFLAAQQDVSAAKAAFDKYSTTPGYSNNQSILVSTGNKKILQDNIALLQSQLDPLIQAQFLTKKNKLPSIDREDPVAWKHDLDEEVHHLADAAAHSNVKIPPNYYFAFSRYLNTNPDDQQTLVLSKQLLMSEQLTTILINAHVKDIQSIRRTYEEDPHPPGKPGAFAPAGEPDRLGGYAYSVSVAGGGIYTDYPYVIDFDTSVESLRQVMDDLIGSPYVFVLRSLSVENSQPNPPQQGDLDRMAGAPLSVDQSAPGEVAAAVSTRGTQFLFGNAPLHVVVRIDLVEWTGGTP